MNKVILLGLLTLLSTGNVHAMSRIGEAEVRDENGTPCFTVAKKEEMRSGAPLLGAITVDDVTTKPVSRIWSFILKPYGRSQPIASKDCIRYGDAPVGSENTKAAELLQTGRIYAVYLNASLADASDPTAGYSARFCLVAQPNGAVKVHQIVYSDGWQDGVCKLN